MGMLILAIDPGRKPGYVLLDTGSLLPRKRFPGLRLPVVARAWLELPGLGCLPPTVVVCEEQWLHGPRKKASILDLAHTGGWQHAAACLTLGGEPATVAVADWRGKLHIGRVEKKIAQQRAISSLTPAESAMLTRAVGRAGSRLGDLADAIMIGWGWWLGEQHRWAPPP